MEIELPHNYGEPMPPETYCKCGMTWVTHTETAPGAGWDMTLRLQCVACGTWTDAVPGAPEK